MSKRQGFQGLIGLILLGTLLILSMGTAISATNSAIRINEVLFNPGAGSHQWVELKNSGAAPINIAGYRITNEAGAWYTIPTALPAVPSGAFVVVVFDGAGSGGDDYDFSDNVATLHSGSDLVDILGKTAGQVGLYVAGGQVQLFLPLILNVFNSYNPPVPAPPTDFPEPAIVSFVAWGADPGDRAANATKAGLWTPQWFKSLARGLGDGSPNDPRVPNETIGALPGSQTLYPDDWTLYPANQASPGSENPVPGISWFYPAAGATIDGATFSVIWAPIEKASGYRFQMDNNSDFSSPSVDKVLLNAVYMPSKEVPPSTVAAGTYYWRVKVLLAGSESPWSTGVEVRSLTFPVSGPLGAIKTLGITWQLQHKDTTMLCLDGDPETGNLAWDRPHTERGTHGNCYCVRASISMMASYYTGKLSQDRITYEIFKGGQPEKQLGHNVGVAPPPDPIETNTLAWALGIAPATIPAQAGKPTFAQIKTWIDGNRPIMARIPGHMRAIDGYFDFTIGVTTWQFIHLLDPWDGAKWVSYANDPIAHVWVGPANTTGAPSVKSDDADLKLDSDGDGINDFDEINRFKTDPIYADSDNDRVPDKKEIREYVFNSAGAFSRRSADIDGDGLRKELDPDNDNGGMDDGCEDSNFNGIFEPALGETDNFKPTDDRSLLITLNWPTPGADVDLHLINPSGGECYYVDKNPDWGVPGITCDDPALDVDCITQCTVEHISLNKLENGSYTVRVHYYSDHDLGPTSPSVTVWLQGVSYFFGPQTLTDDQVWDVCTIDWPSKTIGAGGAVTTLSNTQRLRMPGK